MTRRWNPALHPRGYDGKFRSSSSMPGRDWAARVSDKVASDRGQTLGPQGEFTSEPVWRTFEMGMARVGGQWIGARPGADPLNAEDQIRATEYEYGGLGRWFGPQQMAQAYTSNDGSALVAVRFRPRDLARAADPHDASGIVAPEDTEVAVVAMRVSIDGKWHTLKVPPGLVTATTGARQ